MPTKHVRDLCGLSCVAEFEDYAEAELFFYLIGTGASRSVYELTAHSRVTHALLFDIQVQATAQALETRALAAGSYPDSQAVAIAMAYARRIIDSQSYKVGPRFQLLVDVGGESLSQMEAP